MSKVIKDDKNSTMAVPFNFLLRNPAITNNDHCDVTFGTFFLMTIERACVIATFKLILAIKLRVIRRLYRIKPAFDRLIMREIPFKD